VAVQTGYMRSLAEMWRESVPETQSKKARRSVAEVSAHLITSIQVSESSEYFMFGHIFASPYTVCSVISQQIDSQEWTLVDTRLIRVEMFVARKVQSFVRRCSQVDNLKTQNTSDYIH